MTHREAQERHRVRRVLDRVLVRKRLDFRADVRHGFPLESVQICEIGGQEMYLLRAFSAHTNGTLPDPGHAAG
ncbi:MAG: hypothetical protein KJ060_16400, partial [Candidatus Hydrogenedentes bacterium]|nr:hypothetical protein [Candidatus Hydrogenedentota bacterium]